MAGLTTVSLAMLGLLASGPASAYDLQRSMQRSGTQYLWPRTRSRVFMEPANLVAHGLATAEQNERGRRKTVYTITDTGRALLREWLDTPGGPMSLEWEAMLKVWHAHLGSRAQLVAQLQTIREQLRAECEGLLESVAQAAAPGYPRADRLHTTVLLGEFILEQNMARLRWLEEAERRVASWSNTTLTTRRREEFDKWVPDIRRRIADQLGHLSRPAD